MGDEVMHYLPQEYLLILKEEGGEKSLGFFTHALVLAHSCDPEGATQISPRFLSQRTDQRDLWLSQSCELVGGRHFRYIVCPGRDWHFWHCRSMDGTDSLQILGG